MRIIIIGGGPSGISCALWLGNMGYTTFLVDDGNELGGLLKNNFYYNNYIIGFKNIQNNVFRKKIISHIESTNVRLFNKTKIKHIKIVAHKNSNNFYVFTEKSHPEEINGSCFDYVIIATGTKVSGKEWLENIICEDSGMNKILENIHIGPFSTQETEAYRKNENWLILGSGANAIDLACKLAGLGNSVTICARSAWKDCPKILLDKLIYLIDNKKLNVFKNCELTELFLDRESERKIKAVLKSGDSISVDKIAIMFGFTPNSDNISITPNSLELDINGYFIVDKNFRTSVPGLYAIGDVANNGLSCISTAIGSGAAAAKSINYFISLER